MRTFDLIIVGAGSGNMIPGPEHDHLNVAIVEKGDFGGTCLNRGCIPSKMLVYPADVAADARDGAQLGVHATVEHIDWPAVVARVFGRIDTIAASGEEYRRSLENFTVYKGEARFVAERVLEVCGERITAPRIVLGTGSRPFVPPVPGLDTVRWHTSDTVMRLEELPGSMVVLGGGYIAAELAHVFGAFGTDVTIVVRSDRMLRFEDDDVADRFTARYGDRFDLRTNTVVSSVSPCERGVRVRLEGPEGEPDVVEADTLLVAAGRVPNSDTLALEEAGVACHPDGRVWTDTAMQTSVPGVWAFGDLVNPHQLKHIANAEAQVVAHNVAHPEAPRHMDYRVVPHAVFGHPQVASVGLTERDAVRTGVRYEAAHLDYGATAYGWAMEDTTGFAKILADPDRGLVLGAHLVGPQASTLIQPLVQAMHLGTTVDALAHDVIYIHPALTEVIENALLQLPSAARTGSGP